MYSMTTKKTINDLTPKKAPPADEPVRPSITAAAALQALADGTATAMQQKLALKWIIEQAAMTYFNPYRRDSARDTDFSLGRQFVGQQIVGALKIYLAALKGSDDAKR
jgi:hypothetical protein